MLNKVWIPPQNLSWELNSISLEIRNLTCKQQQEVCLGKMKGVVWWAPARGCPLLSGAPGGGSQPQIEVSLGEIRTNIHAHGRSVTAGLRTKVSW